MIRVGIVGIGFMGWVHWLAYQKLRGVKVAAIATRNKKRLAGDWREIKGNFGPPGEQVDLRDVAAYADADDLLDDPNIDLVDITLPTSLHADVAIRALRAGKHVLCEKPMALTLAECKRMVAQQKRAGASPPPIGSREQGAGSRENNEARMTNDEGKAVRHSSFVIRHSSPPAPCPQLFIGHVLPFFPEYDWARNVIARGKYGRLLGGAFRRVIADPTWMKDYWSPEKIGGPMLDLHVHDAHFIRLMFGMPEVVTTIGRARNNLPEFWHSQFRFADEALVVEATSGTIAQQGRAFDHGFEIHLERATLLFQFAVVGGEGRYLCQPTLLDRKGGVQQPKLTGGDPIKAFVAELREVVECVRAGQPSQILGADLAQDAMRICEKQSASLLRGRPVKF